MANLGIKIEDSEKEAFVDLCTKLGKTQPEMITLMLQAMSKDFEVMSQDFEQVPLVIALRKEVSLQNATIVKLKDEAQSKDESHSTAINSANEIINKLETSLSKYEKDGEPINDLTADIKELSNLTVLRASVHRCVTSRLRIQMKNGNISEQEAVDSFNLAYKA